MRHFTEALHQTEMTNQTIINWETGIVREYEPIFIEFNVFLKRIGLNAIFTQFSNSNYLTIYVFSVSDVDKAKQIVGEKYSEIIDKFFSIANKFGQTPKYDRIEWTNYSVNNIYSFEIACIEKVIRKIKELFTNELNSQLTIKPKYVFCHSAEEMSYSILPGYYIVFENPNDLAKIDESKNNIIDRICDSLLRQNDKTGFYSRDKIQIDLFDAITNSKSLYGMSRED